MAKVLLDAGHYGTYNTSPATPNYVESKRMWDLHILVKKYLEQLGVEVITTREDQEKDLSLATRGKKGAGCDVAISLHSNAVGSRVDDSVDYVVVYVMTNDQHITADDEARELGLKLAKVTAEIMGTTQEPRIAERLSDNDKDGDGVKDDNYYGFLNGTRQVNVPGMILENSFHTNTKMANWLLNDANLDKLARGQAECIASHVLKRAVRLNSEAASTNESKTAGGYKYKVGDHVTVSTHYAGKNDDNKKAVGLTPHLNMKIVGLHYGVRNPYQTDFGTFINDGDIRGYAKGSSLAEVQAKETAAKANHSGKTELPTSSDSGYVIGETYTLVANGVRIRTAPQLDAPILSYDDLSPNAKQHAYNTGTLKKGTKVTCKGVEVNRSGTWIKTPSGWMCARSSKKVYIK